MVEVSCQLFIVRECLTGVFFGAKLHVQSSIKETDNCPLITDNYHVTFPPYRALEGDEQNLPAAVRLLLTVPFFALSLASTAVNAGDPKPAKVYLSNVLEPTSKGKAAFYMQPEGKDGELFIGRIYTMDGKLKAEGRFRDAALTVEEGPFVFYHPNGKVESKGEYVMGNKSGVWLRFDPWGNALAEKVYNPEPLANILYTRAETMPAFRGGDERAFVRTIKEGVAASGAKPAKGQVMAAFVVEKNGELSDVKVMEGQDKALDDQLVDMIRSTSPWAPGVDKGVPVRVQMRVPVQF